ncbi:MAG: beta-N-acetylhexosaminidase [Clostridia bacterium]|nr:beta-N-acetylhexosaminidase [Clostridia bacterium]
MHKRGDFSFKQHDKSIFERQRFGLDILNLFDLFCNHCFCLRFIFPGVIIIKNNICSLGDVMKNKIENFNKFGAMIDCSRNAVMTIEQLKSFITVISRMGYNQVQLYMEDTYEVDDEPFFGYLRGKYSIKELRELDDFAYNLGVELVPNIQTLAHMATFIRWRSDLKDIDDILLVDDEKVYELIERMIKSLRECFRTKKMHIGMDEAHNLGRGRYLDSHGLQNRFDIILAHLNRVCDITARYDFEPMMWSDMFYRIANGGSYYAVSSKFDNTIKEKIPENLTLVYWDYYNLEKKTYDRMIKGHKQLSDKIIFAGGAWKWSGFAPHNYFSIKATEVAIPSCIEHDVKDVFITMWGDNGGECSLYAVLPTLCYAACIAQGITKTTDIKEKFFQWVGVKFDDFILLDSPNLIEDTIEVVNPSKCFLYADCFMSIFQNIEKEEYCKKYSSIARKLKFASKRAGEYSYLFNTLSSLCDLLSIKVNICTRTREAYESSNKADLDNVIADYKKMIKLTKRFYKSFRAQWFIENKPHGFDVQDIRLGGLICRIQACLERLCDYRDGKTTSIPELEEPIVPITEDVINYNSWRKNVSTNNI